MDNINKDKTINKSEFSYNSKQIDWEQDENKVILAIHDWQFIKISSILDIEPTQINRWYVMVKKLINK